jgi:hypothetical protein
LAGAPIVVATTAGGGRGLLVPCRSGTPTYKVRVKIGSGVCTHEPPCALQYQTLPPSQGGLRSCHISNGSGSRLPYRKGSNTATCIMDLDLLGGLRSCHVSSGYGSRLSDKKGSSAAMCVVAPDPLGGLQCTAHPAVPNPTSLQGGLLAAMHPVVPYGLQVSNIKEILADLLVQLGSHVPKKRVHVSKAPDVRAIMGL